MACQEAEGRGPLRALSREAGDGKQHSVCCSGSRSCLCGPHFQIPWPYSCTGSLSILPRGPLPHPPTSVPHLGKPFSPSQVQFEGGFCGRLLRLTLWAKPRSLYPLRSWSPSAMTPRQVESWCPHRLLTSPELWGSQARNWFTPSLWSCCQSMPCTNGNRSIFQLPFRNFKK